MLGSKTRRRDAKKQTGPFFMSTSLYIYTTPVLGACGSHSDEARTGSLATLN